MFKARSKGLCIRDGDLLEGANQVESVAVATPSFAPPSLSDFIPAPTVRLSSSCSFNPPYHPAHP
jgi:hypothetical protein